MVAESKPDEGGSQQTVGTQAATGQPNNTRGIMAMLVAMVSFACGDSLMKLSSVTIPTGELICLRATLMVSVTVMLAWAMGAFRQAWRLLAPPVIARAVGDVGGAVAFQSALARLAFADVIAIIQINPLLVTAASAVFLAERVGWRRWMAAAVGLMGVLLIIRPGTSAFSWWSLLAILSVLFSTMRDVSTKRIDRAVPTVLIMVFSSSVVALGGLTMSLFEDWVRPEPQVLLQIAGAGTFSLIGQMCVIVAVRTGELSAVAPFRYSIVVWALILGLLIWGELPDLATILGMIIVTGAGLYSFHRELVVRRRR